MSSSASRSSSVAGAAVARDAQGEEEEEEEEEDGTLRTVQPRLIPDGVFPPTARLPCLVFNTSPSLPLSSTCLVKPFTRTGIFVGGGGCKVNVLGY